MQRHEFSVELDAPPDEVWEVFWYRGPTVRNRRTSRRASRSCTPATRSGTASSGTATSRCQVVALGWRRPVVGVAHRGEAARSWRYDAIGKPLWSHATGWTRLGDLGERPDTRALHRGVRGVQPDHALLFEKRVHEFISRDNDTILAALQGGIRWHRSAGPHRRRGVRVVLFVYGTLGPGEVRGR